MPTDGNPQFNLRVESNPPRVLLEGGGGTPVDVTADVAIVEAMVTAERSTAVITLKTGLSFWDFPLHELGVTTANPPDYEEIKGICLARHGSYSDRPLYDVVWEYLVEKGLAPAG